MLRINETVEFHIKLFQLQVVCEVQISFEITLRKRFNSYLGNRLYFCTPSVDDK